MDLSPWVLALFASWACVACEGATSSTVGVTTQAIAHGDVSAPDDHAFVVFLRFDTGAKCSGTLISQRVVLTAAHCLRGATKADVLFGNDARDGGVGTWIPAVDLHSHPSVDLALLTLAAIAPRDPATIHRKLLSEADRGRDILLVGFGATEDGSSGVKREGHSVIGGFKDSFVFVDRAKVLQCPGDSGGPAFVDDEGRRFLVAVASLGSPCSDPGGQALMTRTDLQNPWIDEYVDAHPDPTCAADGVCVKSCTKPDPDCPCGDGGVCATTPPTTPASPPESGGSCAIRRGDTRTRSLAFLFLLLPVAWTRRWRRSRR